MKTSTFKISVFVARLSLLFAFILAGAFLSVPGASADGNFAAILDREMPGLLKAYRVPGAIVSYIQNGAVVWTRAYGVANTSTGAPMRADMVLEHGSNGKVLAAWGVMRLADLGKVNLDAPVNQYLKRWKIQSTQFNADGVTLRRLISHTAGLTPRGYADYRIQRVLPPLADIFNGGNQSDGAIQIVSEPGSQFQYASAGFAVAQMVIEDVTGESFASFMQREVTGPLGLTTLSWTWTDELAARTPMNYDGNGQAVGLRQLAVHAAGSEMATVRDFARFIAAAVEGPNGEPAGRGVLRPESVKQMIEAQPNTNGTAGLGYGIAKARDDLLLMHFGSNPGWAAHFLLDVNRREGFVVATNSYIADPMNIALQNLWRSTVLGDPAVANPPPVPAEPNFADKAALVIAALFGIPLLLGLIWFALELRAGKRHLFLPVTAQRLLPAFLWLLPALFWWYWLYGPLPVVLPSVWPDYWVTPQVNLVMGVLIAWFLLGLAWACFPKDKSVFLTKSFEGNTTV